MFLWLPCNWHEVFTSERHGIPCSCFSSQTNFELGQRAPLYVSDHAHWCFTMGTFSCCFSSFDSVLFMSSLVWWGLSFNLSVPSVHTTSFGWQQHSSFGAYLRGILSWGGMGSTRIYSSETRTKRAWLSVEERITLRDWGCLKRNFRGQTNGRRLQEIRRDIDNEQKFTVELHFCYGITSEKWEKKWEGVVAAPYVVQYLWPSMKSGMGYDFMVRLLAFPPEMDHKIVWGWRIDPGKEGEDGCMGTATQQFQFFFFFYVTSLVPLRWGISSGWEPWPIQQW